MLSFYANKVIEITGKHGLVVSSKLYNHSSSDDSTLWSWDYYREVESAAHGHELEMKTTGIGDAFKVYYHLVSWDESEDYSDGFWVSHGTSGARTDPTWTEHTIQSNYDAAWDVYAIDLDRDGDVDVLGAAAGSSSAVTWWENDGSESFTKRTITGSHGGADSVYAIDIDNDGHIDVVSSAGGNTAVSYTHLTLPTKA